MYVLFVLLYRYIYIYIYMYLGGHPSMRCGIGEALARRPPARPPAKRLGPYNLAGSDTA